MLLAFDNTDSKDGGCTSHVAFNVLLALPELALRGLPRLVRLNPNVPWKTRGNAAVVLPLGHPVGPQVRVGELRGREILAFPESPPAKANHGVLRSVWEVLEKVAQEDAMPGLAMFDESPPHAAYWQTVRTFVQPDAAMNSLKALDAFSTATGDGRALVGCLGAAAWPGPPSSYEFIAYREPERWGTQRKVDSAPLRALDGTGVTFHTWDDGVDRATCIPHTPCPVLMGLRGRDPDTLRATAIAAIGRAAQEPVDGWLLWATNQASGDHVTRIDDLGQAQALGTVEVPAVVLAAPQTLPGGHVRVKLRDAPGREFHALAFEPTHAFRDAVRGLRVGDAVIVVGAWGNDSVRLEKLRIVELAADREPSSPLCPACGTTMRSKGRSSGFRCSTCKKRLGPEAKVWKELPRLVQSGWHEVPVMARRHLHRPVAWSSS